MRCLVIGGTKFIGPRVVRQLVKAGATVAILHRGHHNAQLPSGVVQFKNESAGIPVTRFPVEALRFEPDVVIHMIAMGAEDATAAMKAFTGIAKRIVAISSGDVYRAYGRFSGIEPGPLEDTPLSETSSRRTKRYPYRTSQTPHRALEYWYEKIFVEDTVLGSSRLPGVVLRLPKVYGPEENNTLSTVFAYRRQPNWRWTHGHVENVGAAIAFAAIHSKSTGEVFNVGEASTPTMGERLAYLPDVSGIEDADTRGKKNFAQSIDYDTSKIREVLGYRDILDERDAMRNVSSTAT